MIEKLKSIWQHRQSTSLVVASLAAVGMWYMGDLGLTGMPPQWVIITAAFAVGGICTAIIQEMREAGWIGAKATEDG